MKVSALRASYPNTTWAKKIELTPQIDVDAILVAMTEKYKTKIYYHWRSENWLC
jgi:phosphomannomutase